MRSLGTLLILSFGLLSSCVERYEVEFSYHLTLSAAATSAPANGTAIALTVEATNSAGAPMAGAVAHLDVVSGTAVLSQPMATDAHGLASGSITSTTAGSVIVQVVGSPNTPWDRQVSEVTVNFTGVTPPGSPTARVEALPTLLRVGATSAVTVTALDGYGRALPNASIVLSASDMQANISPTQGVTDSQGVFTASLADVHATTLTLTATVTPNGGLPTSSQTSVTFLPGSVSGVNTALAVSPNTVAADNATPARAVLTVADQYGNPVPAAAVTFSVDGLSTNLNANTTSTDANGVASIQVTSGFAQSENVIATVAGVTLHAPVIFNAGAASSLHSGLVASPNSVIADGTSLTNITVTIEDTQGNPLAGIPVSVTASGSGNSGLPTNGNTDASGVFVATLSSTTAGVHAVTATTSGLTLNTNVTFVAGPASSTRSVFTANPNTLLADGTHASALTLTLLDAQGNSVSGQTVTFTSSDALSVVTGSPTTSDANGTATASVASVHAAVTTQTVSASNIVLNAAVTFIAGPPAFVSLTATPNNIVANGIASSAVTFTVQDAQGNDAVNQTVTITGGNANSTGTPATGTTDSNGQFAIHWSSTLAGTSTLTGTCGALQQNVTIITTPGPPVGYAITGLGNVTQAQLVGAVLSAVDANNNVTPNYTGVVTFTSSDSTATLPANYSFAAADLGVHTITRALAFPHVGAQTFTVTDKTSTSITSSIPVNVVALTGTSMVLESQNAATNCLVLPGLNNQVGATLSTSACAFHNDQVFTLGNDNGLHLAGYCVEVATAAYGANATVQLNTCNGAPEQSWALVGNAIQSLGNSNYCLDQISLGATVVMNSCASIASQLWIQHAVALTYAVMNTTVDRVLDVHGGSFSNNSPLVTYLFNASTAQQYNFGFDGTLTALPSSGIPWCVDVPGAAYSVGTMPVINPCTGAAEESWVQVGHTLRPLAAQSLCLDLNTGAAIGQSVLLSTCNGSATQQIMLQAMSSHYKFVEKANTNLCVMTSATESLGSSVTVNTCSNIYQQQLREAGSSDNKATVYAYAGGSANLDGGTFPMSAGTTITLRNSSTDPDSVEFQQTPVGDAFAFISEFSPTLALDGNTTTGGTPLIVNTYAATDTQLFYKWAMSMTIALNSAPTQCLGVGSLVPNVGAPIVVQPCTGAPTQQWVWNQLSAAFQNGGFCMDVSGTYQPGATMALEKCTAVSQQHWNNTGNFSGSTKWFNGLNSGYCLDTNGVATGLALTLQTCQSIASQDFQTR